MKIFFLTLLLLSICLLSFALHNQSIYGVYSQKDIQFKGSSEFQKLKSFLSHDRLVVQGLPHFQTNFYKMHNRKRKSNSSSKATTPARKATTQPFQAPSSEILNNRLLDCISGFFDWAGSATPCETLNLVLNMALAGNVDKVFNDKEFTCETVFEVNRVNEFLVKLKECYDFKIAFDKYKETHGS